MSKNFYRPSFILKINVWIEINVNYPKNCLLYKKVSWGGGGAEDGMWNHAITKSRVRKYTLNRRDGRGVERKKKGEDDKGIRNLPNEA